MSNTPLSPRPFSWADDDDEFDLEEYKKQYADQSDRPTTPSSNLPVHIYSWADDHEDDEEFDLEAYKQSVDLAFDPSSLDLQPNEHYPTCSMSTTPTSTMSDTSQQADTNENFDSSPLLFDQEKGFNSDSLSPDVENSGRLDHAPPSNEPECVIKNNIHTEAEEYLSPVGPRNEDTADKKYGTHDHLSVPGVSNPPKSHLTASLKGNETRPSFLNPTALCFSPSRWNPNAPCFFPPRWNPNAPCFTPLEPTVHNGSDLADQEEHHVDITTEQPCQDSDNIQNELYSMACHFIDITEGMDSYKGYAHFRQWRSWKQSLPPRPRHLPYSSLTPSKLSQEFVVDEESLVYVEEESFREYPVVPGCDNEQKNHCVWTEVSEEQDKKMNEMVNAYDTEIVLTVEEAVSKQKSEHKHLECPSEESGKSRTGCDSRNVIDEDSAIHLKEEIINCPKEELGTLVEENIDPMEEPNLVKESSNGTTRVNEEPHQEPLILDFHVQKPMATLAIANFSVIAAEFNTYHKTTQLWYIPASSSTIDRGSSRTGRNVEYTDPEYKKPDSKRISSIVAKSLGAVVVKPARWIFQTGKKIMHFKE